jgi:hypothetical protein
MTSRGVTSAGAMRPELLVAVEVEPEELVNYAARCTEDADALARLHKLVQWLLLRAVILDGNPDLWRERVRSAAASLPGDLDRGLGLEHMVIASPKTMRAGCLPDTPRALLIGRWEQQAAEAPPPIVRIRGTDLRALLRVLAHRAVEIHILDRYAASQGYAQDAWRKFAAAVLTPAVGRIHVLCAFGTKRLPPTEAEARRRIEEGLRHVAKRQEDPALSIEVEPRRDELFAKGAHERFLAVFEAESRPMLPRWLFWLGQGIQSLTRKETTVGLMHPSLYAQIWGAVSSGVDGREAARSAEPS